MRSDARKRGVCPVDCAYPKPCECANMLAEVTTHTCTSTCGHGPDYCAECSTAVSDWVPWPCPARKRQQERAQAGAVDGLAELEERRDWREAAQFDHDHGLIHDHAERVLALLDALDEAEGGA